MLVLFCTGKKQILSCLLVNIIISKNGILFVIQCQMFQISDSSAGTMKRIERVDDSPPSPLSEEEDDMVTNITSNSNMMSMAVQQGSAANSMTQIQSQQQPPRLPPKKKISQQLMLARDSPRRSLPEKPTNMFFNQVIKFLKGKFPPFASVCTATC